MTKVSETVETKTQKVNGNGKPADAKAEVKTESAAAESKPDAAPKKPGIMELQRQIQEQIDRFQRKNELIAQRERFIQTKNDLVDHLKKMGTDFDETMESPVQKIVLLSKDARYIDDGIKISNNELVFEFIRMLLQKVIEKIAKLEAEIVE